MPPPPPQETPEVDEPPLPRQRCIRTCLTVWVSLLCSAGLLCLVLAMVFASQLLAPLNPYANEQRQAATLCGVLGAALLLPGIVLAISWCSMACQCCCCKDTWICKCCR